MSLNKTALPPAKPPTRRAARGPFRPKGWLLAAIVSLTCLSAASDPLVIEGRDGWLFPVWESLVDANTPRIASTLEDIAFLQQQLAARQITLMAMVIPMKAAFYPERVPPAQPVSAEVSRRYASVLAGLAAAAVPTFDNLRVLRSLEQAGTGAFFRTDYHWTAQGAEASADAAAEMVRAKVSLSPSASGGSKLGEWVNVRRYGDLATRFMTAEQRVALGRDVFTVRAPPKEKPSLLDDEPADVHVVGNSFVQPYLGFPQKLSQVLGRPVSLTWNPGNIGPWVSMLNYLESDTYRQHKPRVILWQLNEPRMHSGPQAAGDWDAESIMSSEAWRKRASAAINR
jgi:alginate O-acetyltransferase complex protein AlgJ